MHPYKYIRLESTDNNTLWVVCNKNEYPKAGLKHLTREETIDIWIKSCETFPVHESQVDGFNILAHNIVQKGEYYKEVLKQGILLQPEMVEYDVREKQIYVQNSGWETTYQSYAFLANQEEEKPIKMSDEFQDEMKNRPIITIKEGCISSTKPIIINANGRFYAGVNVQFDKTNDLLESCEPPTKEINAWDVLNENISISQTEYLEANPVFKEWIIEAMEEYHTLKTNQNGE